MQELAICDGNLKLVIHEFIWLLQKLSRTWGVAGSTMFFLNLSNA